MSSPRTPGPDAYQDQQPSEEEMRAYVEQLRAADPAGVIVQAFQVLGTGAEVKLGRPDARLLIDAMAALVGSVGDRVDGQLVEQLKEVVGQLQSAQVQAEAELRAHAAGQPASEASAGQPAGAPSGAAGGQGPQAQPGQSAQAGRPGQPQGQGGQQMTDRLWIPGRGQAPPGA